MYMYVSQFLSFNIVIRDYLPYSGKVWQVLNLVNQSLERIGVFLIWRSQALPHRVIVYEIILVGFKFGDFPQNHEFTKLKTSPKFPTMWYVGTVFIHSVYLLVLLHTGGATD